MVDKVADSKTWHGLAVDDKLKDTWLERLNALPMLKIMGTCAGHPEESFWGNQWPQVWFAIPVGKAKLADKIICKLARVRFTHVQAIQEKMGVMPWQGTTIYAMHPYDDESREKRATPRWWEEIIAALEAVQQACRKSKRKKKEKLCQISG